MAITTPAAYPAYTHNNPNNPMMRPATASYYRPAGASLGFAPGGQGNSSMVSASNVPSSMAYWPRPAQALPMARPQAYAPAYAPWNNGAINPYAQAQAGFPSQKVPLSAQAMGQKVGNLVSNFLQDNPLLLQKLNNIDMDALEQDLGPKVEKQRARIQQSIIRRLPQRFDERLVGLLDPEFQQLGREGIAWLRKSPDAATLAQIQTDPLAVPGSKPWTRWITDKVKSIWPFNRNKPSAQNNQEAANLQDLEALLNSLPPAGQ